MHHTLPGFARVLWKQRPLADDWCCLLYILSLCAALKLFIVSQESFLINREFVVCMNNLRTFFVGSNFSDGRPSTKHLLLRYACCVKVRRITVGRRHCSFRLFRNVRNSVNLISQFFYSNPLLFLFLFLNRSPDFLRCPNLVGSISYSYQ